MPDNGRVERAIRYVRDSFFAGRNFADVETLNAQADEWRRGIAADRRCPGQDAISVREAFAEEAPRLLPLPDNPYPLIEQVAVKAAPDGAYSWLKTAGWRLFLAKDRRHPAPAKRPISASTSTTIRFLTPMCGDR